MGGGPNSDTSIHIGAVNRSQKFDLFISVKYADLQVLLNTDEYPYTGMIVLNADGTIPVGANTYKTNNLYKGTVKVKFTNGSYSPLRGSTILSGTFEMEAINSEGKAIKITDGRFDIGH